MASAVLTISNDLKSALKRFSWVNWSELARQELIRQEERLKAWKEVERLVKKSQLTQEQADKLSDKVNWSLAKRYEELLKKRRK